MQLAQCKDRILEAERHAYQPGDTYDLRLGLLRVIIIQSWRIEAREKEDWTLEADDLLSSHVHEYFDGLSIGKAVDKRRFEEMRTKVFEGLIDCN